MVIDQLISLSFIRSEWSIYTHLTVRVVLQWAGQLLQFIQMIVIHDYPNNENSSRVFLF